MRNPPRLLLAYKIMKHETPTSNAGVGTTAMHIAKYLRHHGYQADVRGCINDHDLALQIEQMNNRHAHGHHEHPITHVVISAFWMPTHGLARLCHKFPHIHFDVHSHSNDGFFQPDSLGAELLREALDLTRNLPNLSVSGNCEPFVLSTSDLYSTPVLLLPNLYYIDRPKPDRPPWSGSHLKIGIFGANRPQKNQANAAKAAALIAQQLNKDVDIYMNSKPSDTNPVPRTIRAWLKGLPGVTLHEVGWCDWPQFRRLVSHMNLLISPSYTESFCNVVADAVSERTPVVVSEAMDWAPQYWRAHCDDVNDIAHVGRALLSDPRGNYEGFKALTDHNNLAYIEWKHFLETESRCAARVR